MLSSLLDQADATISADDADNQTDEEDADVDGGQSHVGPASGVLATSHVEPEDGRNAEGEPGAEEGTDETEELVEYWDGAGNDVRDYPGSSTDSDPGSPGLEATLVHDVGAAPHADVEVLDADVGIDYTCDDDGWAGDAESDLLDCGAGAAESW